MSVTARIKKLISQNVLDLMPYPAETFQGLIKLDAMENPYPISESLLEKWLQALGSVDINRYPDPRASVLRERIRDSYRLDKSIEMTFGNGSDELIHMLCLVFAKDKSSVVLCPEPTFSVYKLAAKAVGMGYVGVPLKTCDFSLDFEAMETAVFEKQPSLVFIASPNNPTGNLLNASDIEKICLQTPGVVVLDEAYFRFANGTALKQLLSIENLLILQTFSKIGFAGLRLGVLFAASPWIDIIERVRMPYNINSLTQAGAVFALEHSSYIDEQINIIVSERQKMFECLSGMTGLRVWPSSANFILFQALEMTGDKLFSQLLDSGILLKNMNSAGTVTKDCLRVTIGTPSENKFFLNTLFTVLSAH
jgi:histidinol-phosphate aminotransferase